MAKHVRKLVQIVGNAYQDFSRGTRIVVVERELLKSLKRDVTHIVYHRISYFTHIQRSEIIEHGGGYYGERVSCHQNHRKCQIVYTVYARFG